MSRSQRKYAEDYRTTTELDARGRRVDRAVYSGVRYYPQDEKQFKRVKPAYAAAGILAVALYVLAGLCEASSLGGVQTPCAYVALPYVVLLFPTGMMMARALTFAMTGSGMERIRYDRCVRGLRGYTLAYTVLAALTAIGAAVWTFINSAATGDWLLIAISAVMAALGFAFWRLQKRLVFTEKNEG